MALDEWSVTADPDSAPPGTVTFDLQVSRGSRAFTVLPTPNEYYATLLDDRIEIVASIAKIAGKQEVVEAELGPGAYVLICNIEDHYTRGMRTAFEVA